jgi:hypothetical protein
MHTQHDAGRLTKSGEFVITSQLHRDQQANLEDCFVKLHRLLVSASQVRAGAGSETATRRHR